MTPIKALIIGTTNFRIDNISSAQLYPFFANRKQLKKELGLEFQVAQVEKFSEIYQACSGIEVDVLIIRPTWRDDPQLALQYMAEIRKEHAHCKIIFIDPFDQTTSRYFEILPYVDWFLKYQRFRDVSQYIIPRIGGTEITDYLARKKGFEIGDWHVGSEVPKGFEQRVVTGWNLGIDKRFIRDLERNRSFWSIRKPTRNIDIFCRVMLGSQNQQEWYGQYRLMAVNALEPLRSDYRLAVSGEFSENRTTSRRQYFHEIKRSRIAFSPFGWGPTTWRDYEAICYGCLLVKPNISHVHTLPNIYVDYKTYVPVEWDFSDLEEKCRYYLEHWDEAQQIIQNARHAYKDYFEQGEFIQTIRQLIAVQ